MSSLIASLAVQIKQFYTQADLVRDKLRHELVGRKARPTKHPIKKYLGKEFRIKNVYIDDGDVVLDLGVETFPLLADVQIDYQSKPTSASMNAGEG